MTQMKRRTFGSASGTAYTAIPRSILVLAALTVSLLLIELATGIAVVVSYIDSQFEKRTLIESMTTKEKIDSNQKVVVESDTKVTYNIRIRRNLAVNDAQNPTIASAVTMNNRNSINHKNIRKDNYGVQQQSRGRDSCLVVYHIPKTGGVTVKQFINDTLAPTLGWKLTQWYDEALSQEFLSVNEHHVRTIHYGHIIPENFERETQTQNCFHMTIFRDPVQRVVSAFYYHLHRTSDWPLCLEPRSYTPGMTRLDEKGRDYREQEDNLIENIRTMENNPAKTESDKQMLELKRRTLQVIQRQRQMENHCYLWYQYQNDMVRQLASQGTAWNTYDIEGYLGNGADQVDDISLQIAKERLRTFDFVCFLGPRLEQCLWHALKKLVLFNETKNENKISTDHIMASMVENQAAKVATLPRLPRLNRGQKREMVTGDQYSAIGKANSIDVELYKWALENLGNIS